MHGRSRITIDGEGGVQYRPIDGSVHHNPSVCTSTGAKIVVKIASLLLATAAVPFRPFPTTSFSTFH